MENTRKNTASKSATKVTKVRPTKNNEDGREKKLEAGLVVRVCPFADRMGQGTNDYCGDCDNRVVVAEGGRMREVFTRCVCWDVFSDELCSCTECASLTVGE